MAGKKFLSLWIAVESKLEVAYILQYSLWVNVESFPQLVIEYEYDPRSSLIDFPFFWCMQLIVRSSWQDSELNLFVKTLKMLEVKSPLSCVYLCGLNLGNMCRWWMDGWINILMKIICSLSHLVVPQRYNMGWLDLLTTSDIISSLLCKQRLPVRTTFCEWSSFSLICGDTYKRRKCL